MSDLPNSVGAPYTWGRIVRIERFGPYAVVVFHPWRRDGVRVLTNEPEPKRLSYNSFVDGRSTSYGWGSFDEAVLHAVLYRRMEVNAARYATQFVARLFDRVRRKGKW